MKKNKLPQGFMFTARRGMRITMISTKTSCSMLALLLVLIAAVDGGRQPIITFDRYPVSDGIDGDDHVHNQLDQNNSILLLPSQEFEWNSSEEINECDQMYGFLPCSNNMFGHLFLIVVYEYLLFHGESYLAEGSESIFKILGPGFFGASAFHVLGALPESLLLLVSGLLNTKEKAQEYVFTGVGLLAGSSILLLTLVWGTCAIAGRQKFSNMSSSSNIILASNQNYSNPSTFNIFLYKKRLGAFLTGYGITTDSETSYLARIMAFSVIPFVIIQIVNIFRLVSSVERSSILISLLLAIVLLLLYFVYQIFQPWIQKRRLEYVKHAHLISSILQHVQKRALGRLLTQNGAPNVQAIRRLFDEIDEDRDNFISPSEVKELFLEIEFKAVEANKEQAIAEVMTKFDIDGDRKITKDEFVDGLTKWLDEVKYAVDRQIYSPRSLKDINQVFQPWVQNKRREREIKRTIMLDIQENFLRIGHGRLLTENGKPNLPNIRRLFEQFDRDGDNFISERELRALILDIRFGKISMEVLNEAAKGLMQELDTSGDNLISEQEFVKGLEKWLINTTPIQASKSSVGSEDEIYPKSGEETDKLEEEAESKGIVVENSPQAWMKAIMYLVIGIITLSVLAEPLIESVQKFSEFAGIPSFFISFILVPLATNARAATSAISTASHKTPRTTSLTFSEIYGGVFMNNILGFSVLLSLIYFREMTWEFSAEVLVVLIVCFIVGLVASFRFTFALWTASIAYMLYPVSLLLVYVFNNVLQYV